MKLDELLEEIKKSCWKGYKKRGTKIKDGKRVNNCIKESITKKITSEAELKYYMEDYFEDDIQDLRFTTEPEEQEINKDPAKFYSNFEFIYKNKKFVKVVVSFGGVALKDDNKSIYVYASVYDYNIGKKSYRPNFFDDAADIFDNTGYFKGGKTYPILNSGKEVVVYIKKSLSDGGDYEDPDPEPTPQPTNSKRRERELAGV